MYTVFIFFVFFLAIQPTMPMENNAFVLRSESSRTINMHPVRKFFHKLRENECVTKIASGNLGLLLVQQSKPSKVIENMPHFGCPIDYLLVSLKSSSNSTSTEKTSQDDVSNNNWVRELLNVCVKLQPKEKMFTEAPNVLENKSTTSGDVSSNSILIKEILWKPLLKWKYKKKSTSIRTIQKTKKDKRVELMCFNETKNIFARVAKNNTIKIRNILSRKLIQTIKLTNAKPPQHIIFSPGGTFLAVNYCSPKKKGFTADNVFNVESGQNTNINADKDAYFVNSYAFSWDDNYLCLLTPCFVDRSKQTPEGQSKKDYFVPGYTISVIDIKNNKNVCSIIDLCRGFHKPPMPSFVFFDKTNKFIIAKNIDSAKKNDNYLYSLSLLPMFQDGHASIFKFPSGKYVSQPDSDAPEIPSDGCYFTEDDMIIRRTKMHMWHPKDRTCKFFWSLKKKNYIDFSINKKNNPDYYEFLKGSYHWQHANNNIILRPNDKEGASEEFFLPSVEKPICVQVSSNKTYALATFNTQEGNATKLYSLKNNIILHTLFQKGNYSIIPTISDNEQYLLLKNKKHNLVFKILGDTETEEIEKLTLAQQLVAIDCLKKIITKDASPEIKTIYDSLPLILKQRIKSYALRKKFDKSKSRTELAGS